MLSIALWMQQQLSCYLASSLSLPSEKILLLLTISQHISLSSFDRRISHSAAKRKMWKLKSFGSLRNINKTGNHHKPGRMQAYLLISVLHTASLIIVSAVSPTSFP